VLEGEIVEPEIEGLSRQPATNLSAHTVRDSQEGSGALVNWLLLEEDTTFGPDYLSQIKTWLDFFLTPCRLSTLGVLLLANILLVWSQLTAPKNAASRQATSEIPFPVAQPQALASLPKLDLATEKPELALNSFSIAAPASQTAKVAKASLPNHAAPLGAASPSLSNALLPYLPALPQQSIPSNRAAQVPVPPPPPAPTSQYFPVPAPALPSVPQQPIVEPPQPPSPNDPAKQSSIRQDLGSIPSEGENLPPLGFTQEYRVKVQSHQSQTAPNQLRRQLHQLQQQAIPTKLE
jgi:hypothetical protein